MFQDAYMKEKKYKGKLKEVPTDKIYLNVDALKEGEYILKITHKNKVIKRTKFKKE